MKNSKFHQMFMSELKEVYWTEKKLIDALKEMEGAANSSRLADAFREHCEQTKRHAERVEHIFERMEAPAEEAEDESVKGMIEEARKVVSGTEGDSMVRDAALIIAAQKIEHYEIAAYGSLRTLARTMEHNQAAEMLDTTLEEEKETDRSLTELAESFVNVEASEE